MNKTFCKKKYLLILLLTGCLILFNASCGLDTFYVIDPPSVYHQPIYSSIEQSENYFEFSTVENDYEGIKFLGTEVYYKIYDDTSKLNTEYSNINSLATGDNSTNQAADRMIITYKYQPLRCSSETGANILVPNQNTSRRIRIRLANYHDYEAEFSVDSSSTGIPVRNIHKNPAFSFKEISSDLLPKADDEDYASSGSTEAIENYYICMFAVAVAQDITYSRLYSNVAYLGSVTISMVD